MFTRKPPARWALRRWMASGRGSPSSIAILGSKLPWDTADPSTREPPSTRQVLAIHSPQKTHEPQDEPSFYSNDIDRFASKPTRPVTLQNLLQMCEPPLTREKLLQNARYLCRERPIRYAKRVKLFQRLPFIVNSNPFINEVYRMYYRNFEESRGFPMVETLEDHEAFIQMLTRHSDTLKHIMPQIARGFFETRMYFGTRARQTFLDQLISMRISLRLLTSQHIALHNGYTNGACHSVIDRIVLGDTVRACAQGVQTMCEMSYDSAPDFEVDGDAAAFHYIEPHLEYMVVELLKNAFRSSLQAGQDGEIPRVLITVSKGNGKVAIRIRDHGGGIPRRIHDKIFDYAFTTVEHQDSADPAASETRAAEPPFAGLGFGLPMTKLYAEYFGGSLHIVSLEGYGCDAFLELPSIKVDRVPAITI